MNEEKKHGDQYANISTGADDLSHLEDLGTRSTALDDLMPYVQALEQMQADILVLETDLDEAKKNYRDLAEVKLPSLLQQHGLEEVKLSNGKRLSIKEGIYARLPENSFVREELLAWLAENGGGEKIKDEVTVDEVTEELIQDLEKLGASFSRRRTVNTNSLQAWFNEALGLKRGSMAILSMEDIPKKFGVYVKREAVLK